MLRQRQGWHGCRQCRTSQVDAFVHALPALSGHAEIIRRRVGGVVGPAQGPDPQ
jgi:hypothetical protein